MIQTEGALASRKRSMWKGLAKALRPMTMSGYKTWPEPWTETDKSGGWYLRSMTPREELASFLATRGDCLTDNGRLGETVQAYAWASAIAPEDTRYQQILSFTHHKYLAQL